jgi:hypothetical protein
VVHWVVSLFILLAAAPAAAHEPTPASASISVAPEARGLFERDWVLMNWALKFHDSNRDILLEPGEAQLAADEFRKIADTNADGRVTQDEYRAARAFILARY